ncbi:MAG: hypothetical protein ACI898_002302, partial [Flavobacteriales bacterium]
CVARPNRTIRNNRVARHKWLTLRPFKKAFEINIDRQTNIPFLNPLPTKPPSLC